MYEAPGLAPVALAERQGAEARVWRHLSAERSTECPAADLQRGLMPQGAPQASGSLPPHPSPAADRSCCSCRSAPTSSPPLPPDGPPGMPCMPGPVPHACGRDPPAIPGPPLRALLAPSAFLDGHGAPCSAPHKLAAAAAHERARVLIKHYYRNTMPAVRIVPGAIYCRGRRYCLIQGGVRVLARADGSHSSSVTRARPTGWRA